MEKRSGSFLRILAQLLMTLIVLLNVSACASLSATPNTEVPISGIWQGFLTTEAVNVQLRLELLGSGTDYVGTWLLLGAGGEQLGSGDAFGAIINEEVVLILNDRPPSLVGRVENQGNTIRGTLQDEGGNKGTFELARQELPPGATEDFPDGVHCSGTTGVACFDVILSCNDKNEYADCVPVQTPGGGQNGWWCFCSGPRD